MERLALEPLTPAAFAPFGEVLEVKGEPLKYINQGRCGRFHDMADVDVDEGKVGISLFGSAVFALPFQVEMVERHPLGSQAFLSLDGASFLVVVAGDESGKPAQPRAFLAAPGQGINIRRNCWHGVLTPLSGSGIFAVVDYCGDAPNLQEHWLETPFVVEA